MRETSAHETQEASLPDRVSVVVVGGGIAGTSAAYHAAKAGADVLLLERGRIGGGATAAALGILSPPLRQPYHETVAALGETAAKNLWRFALQSTENLGSFLRDRGASDLADLNLGGGHVLAEPHTDHQTRESFRALSESGFPVEWIERETLRAQLGGHGFTGGFRIAGGGGFDPEAATMVLAQAASEAGATIQENVDVAGVEWDEGGLVCTANGKAIRCDSVVYATHVEGGRFSALIGREIVPIRGQGFETEPIEPLFQGCFATDWKLNVWRQAGDGRLLVSGWRHDALDRAYGRAAPEVDDSLQSDLCTWFERSFPGLKPLRVKHRWSGVFGWTADYLPLVGTLPGQPREFVISGFSGGGLPFAFDCGRSIARQLTGGDPLEGAEQFSPSRFIRD